MATLAGIQPIAEPKGRATTGYQSMLVLLLGINLGFVFLDRGAFGLLAPLIQPEFRLSNTQVGMITGALAVTRTGRAG